METNFTKNVEWNEEKSSDLFFPVDTQQVKCKGVKTQWNVLYRTKEHEGIFGKDEIHPISIISDRYSIIHNADINRHILNATEGSGVTLDHKMSYNYKNKRFNLAYDIPYTMPFDGDDLKPRMFVKNSYDCSTGFEFTLGFFRLVCSNGLVIPVAGKHWTVYILHKGQFDIQKKIQMVIDDCLSDETFKIMADKIEAAKEISDVKIDVKEFFAGMGQRDIMLFSGLLLMASNSMKIVCGYKEEGDVVLNQYNGLKLAETAIKYNNIELDEEKIAKNFIVEGYSYNEDLKNKWDLYNFLVKAIQISKRKHQRLAYAQRLGRFLL